MARKKDENNSTDYFALGYLTALILTILSPLLPLIGAVVIAVLYIENKKS